MNSFPLDVAHMLAGGMVLVSFNVNKEGFDKRKSLGVVIQPYDQPRPIVLTK